MTFKKSENNAGILSLCIKTKTHPIPFKFIAREFFLQLIFCVEF